MVTERDLEMIKEEEVEAIEESMREFRQDDPVIRNVGFVYFVSKTKGRRRIGTKIYRRNWKEIELIRYQSGWHYPHRANLDEVASELTSDMMDGDQLLWYIRNNCDERAGCMKPGGIL